MTEPHVFRRPAANIERCVDGRCAGGCEAPGRRFYVTVVDAGRVGFLAGPFLTHQAALDRVDEVRRLAGEVDYRAHWYGFGTCLMDGAPYPAGSFNARLVGMEVAA